MVDGVEPADPEVFRTMLAQTERLGRLVQQLLDLSRLESGALQLDRREFDVAPMLELAVRRLNEGAELYGDSILDKDDQVLEADREEELADDINYTLALAARRRARRLRP